ncbi:hypothetical protein HC928_03145 [bacterium]|nr:hypothetical protein [bacterium]
MIVPPGRDVICPVSIGYDRVQNHQRGQPMQIRGIKRGNNIELLGPLNLAEGQEVTLEILPVESTPQKTFWEAICEWRATINWDEWDDSDPWEDVRDRSPGRDFSWDDD